MRVKPYWPEKPFIVFMFSQTFDWRHQNIIISKEIVQNEFWKTITETSILSWIQNNNLYRNVQLKKKSGISSKHLKSSFVISRVFKICLGSIHIWRQIFWVYFWPTYLPKYPDQILYHISLFSKIRYSLTYLPT